MTATSLIILAVALALLPNLAGTPSMSDEPIPQPEPEPTPAPPVSTVGDFIARVKASETRLAAANEAYAADAASLSSALKAVGHPVWDRDDADMNRLMVYEHTDSGGFKRTAVMAPTTPVPVG